MAYDDNNQDSFERENTTLFYRAMAGVSGTVETIIQRVIEAFGGTPIAMHWTAQGFSGAAPWMLDGGNRQVDFASATPVNVVIPKTTNIQRMGIKFDVAGTSDLVTIGIFKNAVATELIATKAGNITTASLYIGTSSVEWSAGDTMSVVLLTAGGTPPSSISVTVS